MPDDAHVPLRTLLVEDTPAVRDRLRALLEAVAGVNVLETAATVAEAIAAAQRLAPDLIVLDLQLARGSGLDVLRAVKRAPGLTVVVLTNHASPQHRARCLAAGADAFFDKSADLQPLFDLIEQLVRP